MSEKEKQITNDQQEKQIPNDQDAPQLDDEQLQVMSGGAKITQDELVIKNCVR